ncbi:hypothetical protein DFH27DRAFT_618114 [Peziza echinospora]|nr:hypothetical protein DFH27DRAFT_618114 [Peziza echinospora]
MERKGEGEVFKASWVGGCEGRGEQAVSTEQVRKGERDNGATRVGSVGGRLAIKVPCRAGVWLGRMGRSAPEPKGCQGRGARPTAAAASLAQAEASWQASPQVSSSHASGRLRRALQALQAAVQGTAVWTVSNVGDCSLSMGMLQTHPFARKPVSPAPAPDHGTCAQAEMVELQAGSEAARQSVRPMRWPPSRCDRQSARLSFTTDSRAESD